MISGFYLGLVYGAFAGGHIYEHKRIGLFRGKGSFYIPSEHSKICSFHQSAGFTGTVILRGFYGIFIFVGTGNHIHAL